MKQFNGFGVISRLPRRVKIVGSFLGVFAIGFFTYYLTVVNPLFGGAAQPTITTAVSTNIKQTGATFNGTVNTDGGSLLRSKGFEYGLTTSYGSITSDTTANSYAYAYQWGSQGTGNNQFSGPEGIAKDTAGNVYVIDNGNHRVMKFSNSGTYISQWGSQGLNAGQFNFPHGITIDSSDHVYVADTSNNRIQQFTTAGVFVRSFGTFGTNNGEMIAPSGVEVDVFGNVYVADTLNHRIQKFSSTGTYLSKWGSQGTGDYQFNLPYAIDTDPAGNVYIADKGNRRIIKFNTNATFVAKWGSQGTGDGEFQNPSGLTIDNYGYLYVTDNLNHRIQKFTDSGTYVTKYGTQGTGNYNLAYPTSIFTDSVGGVFIADNSNHRIIKITPVMGVGPYNLKVNDLVCATTYHYRSFAENATDMGYGADQTVTTTACSTPLVDTLSSSSTTTSSSVLQGDVTSVGLSSISDQGIEYGTTTSYGTTLIFPNQPYQYSLKWGTMGAGDGQLEHPSKIVIESSGNFFVADTNNNRIQKFDSGGTYISQWGTTGSGDGQFNSPSDLTIDSSGNIYVADTNNNRIQKFDSGGTYISQWGTTGSGDGQFNSPWGIAIDTSNNIYVADKSNDRIQKFNSSGTFIAKWGSLGSGNGQFQGPRGIAVDSTGDILVGDYGRVQKFDSSGSFISSFGSNGTANGQFQEVWDIDIDTNGNIFAVDTFNSRIQEFNPAGQFLNKWGSSGSADGQFSIPYGLAIDGSNNVFVADQFNNRIQKFAPKVQTGAFSLTASSLTCGTTYHYRAFATNFYGTANGDDLTFDTSACPLPPSVSTQSASNITGTVARFNGTVDSFSTNNITERGFQFGLTTGYGQTQTVPFMTITDVYSSSSGELICGTTYHYRAYAINAVGTSYGSDSSFTTFACPLPPTVTTQQASNLTQNTSILHGTVTSEGSASLSTRGFEYGLDTNYGQSTSEAIAIQYAYSGKFGTYGSGANQFSNIPGIAREQDGNVLVADIDNNRIMRFDSSGAWIGNVISGPADGAPANPFHPKRVTTDSIGNIYTTDSLDRVQKFDSNGTYITSFGSTGTGNSQFSESGGIAVDSDFNIYVADQSNNRIQKFDSNGNYISQWGTLGTGNGQFDFPTNVIVDASGAILVTDYNNNRIQKFEANGTFISTFGVAGTSVGEFDHPYSLSLDEMNNIYVSDLYNHRIQKFDANGTFITSFGSVGSDPGQIASGVSIASTPSGTIYLADNNGGGLLHISRFDPIISTGAYQLPLSGLTCSTTYHYRAFATSSIGTSTGSDQSFTSNACPLPAPTVSTESTTDITGSTATFNGTINSQKDTIFERGIEFGTSTSYGDVVSEQIQHYAYSGSLGTSGTGNGQFIQPNGSSIDSAGNIYIADTANNRIQKFDANGTYLSQWGVLGSGDGEFTGPNTVRIAPSGDIYVADSNNHRIQKFDASGTFITKWGTPGSADGEFSNPTALAIDSNNNVYVVDYSNFRIQKFDANGTFITKWGTQGSGDGQINAVKDIVIDQNDLIYISDNNNYRIQKFDANGTFITKWGTQGIGASQFGNIQGLAVDSVGNIYATDTTNNRVVKFDSGGNPIVNIAGITASRLVVKADGTLIASDGLNDVVTIYGQIHYLDQYFLPGASLTCGTIYHVRAYAVNVTGVGYGADRIFTTPQCLLDIPTVTTDTTSTIGNTAATLNGTTTSGLSTVTVRGFNYGVTNLYGQVINEVTPPYSFAGTFGSYGDGDGQFASPFQPAVDSQGNIYVVDLDNSRIQKFDSSGIYVSHWGTHGSGDGQLNAPTGIAIDGVDRVLVADQSNNRIQVFDTNGNFIFKFGSLGSGEGQFTEPRDVVADSTGNIYVADTFANRIQKFDRNGNFISKITDAGPNTPAFGYPMGIDVDSADNLYVVDTGNASVKKFGQNGEYLSEFGTFGSQNGQLNAPYGVAIDSNDSIFVTDTENNRIQKFDSTGAFLAVFGSFGTNDSQFDRPLGITIDSSNSLYVADLGNNRIQKFSPLNWTTTFSSSLTDLTCGTTYHVQAFAANATGTGVGADATFTTTSCPIISPTVSTLTASNITESSASANGSITYEGTSSVTLRGFQYGLTTSYGSTLSESAGELGSFTRTINGLTCGTTYHFRAFASNASTTSYGIDRILNTLSCPAPPPVIQTPPTVISQPASDITKISSTLNATITAQGSSPIVTRGFEYGLNGSFGFSTVENSNSIGAFERVLNSFVCGTTYTFRAFATSAVGRSYGSNQTFTTSECNVAPVITIVAPANKQIFPATTKKIDLSTNATSTTSQISRVDFYIDGLLFGAVSEPPYILSAEGVTAGNHVLTARAYDKTGVSTTSKATSFTLLAAIAPPRTTTSNGQSLFGGRTTINPLNRETFTRDKPIFGILGALTTPVGAKIFKSTPISLVAFLLILAALYAMQSLYEYLLKRKLIATIHRYELTLTTANDFISIASHYLNTPAAILSGAVELVTSSKSIPANLAADLTSKITNFTSDVKKLLNQQSIETKVDPANKVGLSKNSNPFKDKSVIIPAAIVFGLLGVAGLLSLNISAIGTSGARKLIEFGMFILAFILLSLSARSRKISKAARKLKREQLNAQAELYEKRRAFIESTRVMIDTHLQALTVAGSRLKKVPQAKLYFNGLSMIQSLENGLRTIHEATDMKSVASILVLSPQVEKQLGDYESTLLETGIFMTSSISPNITTRLKPEELHQLVGSVVENAIKFSKRDDTITVSLRKSFGKIKLIVSDHGSGVSKDKLYELFQPFARATDSMKYDYEGAGLNLYIDKVILARIGGHIEMKSHEGIGTTVVITMPSIDVRDGLVSPSVITPIISSSKAIVR